LNDEMRTMTVATQAMVQANGLLANQYRTIASRFRQGADLCNGGDRDLRLQRINLVSSF
jgi:hypothetical protein